MKKPTKIEKMLEYYLIFIFLLLAGQAEIINKISYICINYISRSLIHLSFMSIFHHTMDLN